jgi:hypothetical protein
MAQTPLTLTLDAETVLALLAHLGLDPHAPPQARVLIMDFLTRLATSLLRSGQLTPEMVSRMYAGPPLSSLAKPATMEKEGKTMNLQPVNEGSQQYSMSCDYCHTQIAMEVPKYVDLDSQPRMFYHVACAEQVRTAAEPQRQEEAPPAERVPEPVWEGTPVGESKEPQAEDKA